MLPNSMLSLAEVSPEQRNSIVHRLRLRLVELCNAQYHWLVGGTRYLKREGNQWICRNTHNQSPATIIWEWKSYYFEVDENKHRNTCFHKDGWCEKPTTIFFKMKGTDGNGQDVFHEARMWYLEPRQLLSTLSERSVQTVDIPQERRFKHIELDWTLWPREEVQLGERAIQMDEALYPQCITIVLADDEKTRISYRNDSVDLSFTDIENGNRWYPDFSQIHKRHIIKKHWLDYLTISCWCSQTKWNKKHLLSRPGWFWNFEKHYLQVGSNRFEVIHLVGDTQAQIKFLDGDYRVDVDEAGNMKSRQQRYISLSGASTFWYDLKEHKRLDHEPV